MAYYTKKPIPVEAVHYTRLDGEDWDDAWERLVEFTDHKVDWSTDEFTGADHFQVYDHLHDTWVTFYLEDWLLKGTEGEFYPHNGELFLKNYESAASLPTPEHHNHITRDIRPAGQCYSCDRYHALEAPKRVDKLEELILTVEELYEGYTAQEALQHLQSFIRTDQLREKRTQ